MTTLESWQRSPLRSPGRAAQNSARSGAILHSAIFNEVSDGRRDRHRAIDAPQIHKLRQRATDIVGTGPHQAQGRALDRSLEVLEEDQGAQREQRPGEPTPLEDATPKPVDPLKDHTDRR
eukprot:2583948-Pyramimonas_sp.AAC.1